LRHRRRSSRKRNSRFDRKNVGKASFRSTNGTEVSEIEKEAFLDVNGNEEGGMMEFLIAFFENHVLKTPIG